MTLEDKMQEKYEEGVEVGKAEAISTIETAGLLSEEDLKKIKELLRQ